VDYTSSKSAEELIRACAESNDPKVWNEFVARFHRPISLSILRVTSQWGAIPRYTVDDLVQETYLKLCVDRCNLLREFASRHPDSIVGYIKAIAVNVARDYIKSIYSKKRGAGQETRALEDAENPADSNAQGSPAAIEQEVLLKQLEDCVASCSEGPDQERDRLIFWLYYRQGMSAKAIADLPSVGLSAKGVESAIFRLTRLVREQVVGLQHQSGTDPAEGAKGFRPAESY
jgi:RNA polymerase sigma-70 factor, ECF subfamily